jgi:hypothetical protein
MCMGMCNVYVQYIHRCREWKNIVLKIFENVYKRKAGLPYIIMELCTDKNSKHSTKMFRIP